MVSFKKNRHAVRMQHGLQSICNLLTDPFLHRKAFGKDPHETRQLGNADDVFVGNVTNIGIAVKWKSMVFAKRKKGDGSLQYLA